MKPQPRTDGSEKLQKNPRGFYCILDLVVGQHQTRGYSTFAEAVYQVRRYWSRHVSCVGVSIYLNGKVCYYINTSTRKETFFMSQFSQFRAKYAKEAGHSMDSLPSLKAEERTVFIRAGIPFSLGADSAVTQGQYGSQISYHVVVDTSSPEWKNVGSIMNLATEYTFWVKATDGRTMQYNQLVKPLLEKNTLFILVKPEAKEEGPWDFDLYVPGKPVADLGDTKVNADANSDDFDPFLDQEVALP